MLLKLKLSLPKNIMSPHWPQCRGGSDPASICSACNQFLLLFFVSMYAHQFPQIRSVA